MSVCVRAWVCVCVSASTPCIRIAVVSYWSLAQIAKDTAFASMDQLLKFYKSHFLDKEGILAKPNDFSNLIAYHLQKVRGDTLSLSPLVSWSRRSDDTETRFE